MNAWLLVTIALALPLFAIVFMCARGPVADRLAAAQMASSLGVLTLVAMTFAFSQASSMDLALTLAFLTLPATLLFAVFVERWL